MTRSILLAYLLLAPSCALAAGGPEVLGIPVDFILFALTLLGVALFHHHTLYVALTGLTVITLYKLGLTGFHGVPGLDGLAAHLGHEWVTIVNLLGLLLGFALLARHFEESGVPEVLPRYLPDDWKGGFVLLVMVFVLSSFLDNIAAALIGATIAATVFRRKVHIGYLAAIVAASNAGGAGSVVGDTTTTMMWIDGVSPLDVLHAYAAAIPALLVFGVIAARQQAGHAPIHRDTSPYARVDWLRVAVVGFILAAAIATNVTVNTHYPEIADAFPFLGVAVWVALLAAAPLKRPQWSLLPEAFKGSVFLLSLVLCASMMPVEKLPAAAWQTALGLGFVSAVFDNIPLTALALTQGGYDWGVLAYAVGFGGSMIWFGSSAGVALSNIFPEARSVGAWLKNGWHVAVGYVIGFFIMLAVVGWHPHTPHKERPAAPPAAATLPH
ncbi:MAG: citrate transporter [Gallionellaceae bacterium]|nr:citrate transporter [Gallionellaceae bacterium]